jgi:hypothetical protein
MIFYKKNLDGSGGYVGDGLHFNPFGEVFYCDDSEGVVSLCRCMFINNVDTPPMQGLGWGNQL